MSKGTWVESLQGTFSEEGAIDAESVNSGPKRQRGPERLQGRVKNSIKYHVILFKPPSHARPR